MGSCEALLNYLPSSLLCSTPPPILAVVFDRCQLGARLIGPSHRDHATKKETDAVVYCSQSVFSLCAYLTCRQHVLFYLIFTSFVLIILLTFSTFGFRWSSQVAALTQPPTFLQLRARNLHSTSLIYHTPRAGPAAISSSLTRLGVSVGTMY